MLRTPLLRVSSTCQTDPPPPVAFESRALVQVASRASRPAALRVRGMAGAVKVQETGLMDVIAPHEVARTEPLHEMGVLYPPGVPSPMEAVLANPPIIVDGLIAKTGERPHTYTTICPAPVRRVRRCGGGRRRSHRAPDRVHPTERLVRRCPRWTARMRSRPLLRPVLRVALPSASARCRPPREVGRARMLRWLCTACTEPASRIGAGTRRPSRASTRASSSSASSLSTMWRVRRRSRAEAPPPHGSA